MGHLATERPLQLFEDRKQTSKERFNYTINKQTIDKFKAIADKDMRKMSNIVENLIRRYLVSKVKYKFIFYYKILTVNYYIFLVVDQLNKKYVGHFFFH